MNLKRTAEQLLGKTLKPTDGIDAQHIQQREDQLGITLPSVLHSFYATLGNIELFVDGFQHFLPLDKLFIDQDKLVFLQEHQAGVCWAVSLQDGQTVYQTTDVDFDKPVTWCVEDFKLDEFLTMLLYWQCVMAEDNYHDEAGSGFVFFALLSNPFAIEGISQQVVNQMTQGFACVIDNAGVKIYWQPDTIVMGILDQQMQCYDTLFACSKQEQAFDKLIDEYGFEQL